LNCGDLAAKFHAGPEIDSILNRTLIDKETNGDYIRAHSPKEYIAMIMKDQGVSAKTLRKRFFGHLISDDAFKKMQSNDFEGFLVVRSRTIKAQLKKLIGEA
jgi:hypothetical protein